MIIENCKKLAAVILGSILFAVAINLFLIPGQVLSSGFTGVSQLISFIIEKSTTFALSTGIILFLFNIPVLILGWYKIGRSFTIYSFSSIFLLAFFLEIIPIHTFSDDIMLNAVYGGVFAGLGTGLTLKFGSSTGGLDIILTVVSKFTGKTVGFYFMASNGIIVILAGAVFGQEKALYTLISIFVTSRVIDYIHTNHEKLTLTIVTDKADILTKEIQNSKVRGVTIVPARGGYTNHKKEILIVVITRYELYDIKKIIMDKDPKAFTNITETIEVLGYFRKE